jgi:hypothetical protein
MLNNYVLQHAWTRRDLTIAAVRRQTRTSQDGEGPTGQAKAPRCGAKTAVATRINRPPVKSTDRPGVAPRRSRDGKGRAQSPHPAWAGSKRRIARRTWRRILHQAVPLSAIRRGTDRLALDRLNASMKPIAITRSQHLAVVEADAPPVTARVHPALVSPQQSLWPRSASRASAAR